MRRDVREVLAKQNQVNKFMWEIATGIDCAGFVESHGGYVFYVYTHEEMNSFETWLDENVGRQGEEWRLESFLEGAYRRYIIPSEDAAALTKIFWC